jgi:large subunit ribosomal protein L22
MPGVKTNEREGTRAVLRYSRTSPSKVREVLDLVRGEHVARAAEILRFSERDAAQLVAKLLASAVANAENNDGIDPEELYVSACFADEGPTLKRFRPRARGRASRIRKRTCHITVIVSRMPEEELRRYRAKHAAEQAARRARRVAGGRRGATNEPTAPEGGRARRFRRGQVADEESQVEAVEEVHEHAEEEGVVENTPVPVDESQEELAADVAESGGPGEGDSSADAGESTEEPAEGSPESAPDEGAERNDQ